MSAAVVPESVLRRRKREEQWAADKKEKALENRKVIFARAKQYTREYDAQIAKVFGPRQDFEVRFLWGKTMKIWPMKASVDGENGHMYLRDGWATSVQANKLRLGDFLVFSYYREDGVLGVKVFDTTCCRRIYSEDGFFDADLQ